MYETLPYTIIVPALALRNRPGTQNQAVIDFDREPLVLGNTFSIVFWFRPDVYPQGEPTAVVTANLKTADGAERDLVLRIWNLWVSPEFQGYFGPMSYPAPPLGKWTYLGLLYSKGKLQTMYWHEGQLFHEASADINDENYRLTRLALSAENGAEHAFAELRLWNWPNDYKDLDDFRERPPDGNAPGLLGYWKLDEGSGTLMVDSSTGGNDGVIYGGEWQRDSGLSLEMGVCNAGGMRQHIGDRKSGMDYGQQRAQWIYRPRLDAQIAHLETLLAARQRVKQQENSQVQAQKSELSTLQNTKQIEEERRAQKQRELDEKRGQKVGAIRTQREEVEARKKETLARIESSRKIHLKDFILRLQDDLAFGREKIRKEYGRVYGLDSVSMEVKVVPGVGGIGLHLPDPDTRIDPSRLSTLKLRFRAGPAEGEEKVKLAEVPWLEGSTEDFARRRLAQAGFRVDVVYQEVADPVQHGRILTQIYDAKEGNKAELDSIITLIVGQRQ